MRSILAFAVMGAAALCAAAPAGAITDGATDGRLDTESARNFLGDFVRLP